MSNATAELKLELENKFAFLKDKIRMQRERRLWAEVDQAHFFELLDHLKARDFFTLCTITGLDEGERLGFIYHLSQMNGIMFNLHTSIIKDKETLPTVVERYPNATIYERELADLFGVTVAGLAPGTRYPLPDDWPAGQYPLRKDWDVKSLDQMGGGA